jgi:uncharacterized protein (DUF427 family)
MPKASWKGAVIAESDDFVEVEGNVYFPASALRREHFVASDHTSECAWKGTARYYHVVVGGERNENAAWYYPDPKPAAAQIRDRVAFWRGVTVDRG